MLAAAVAAVVACGGVGARVPVLVHLLAAQAARAWRSALCLPGIAATAAREEAAELKGEAARLRAKLDASDAAANQLRSVSQPRHRGLTC